MSIQQWSYKHLIINTLHTSYILTLQWIHCIEWLIAQIWLKYVYFSTLLTMPSYYYIHNMINNHFGFSNYLSVAIDQSYGRHNFTILKLKSCKHMIFWHQQPLSYSVFFPYMILIFYMCMHSPYHYNDDMQGFITISRQHKSRVSF